MDFSHPFAVLAMLGLAASLILLLTVFKVRSIGLRLALVFLSVLTLAPSGLVLASLFPEWVDARFRCYKTFYSEIQPGMTRDEVLAVQARIYPEDGPRRKPRLILEDEKSLTFFMHPEHTDEPNCEGIFLALKDGRVVSKTYSPD